MIGLFGTCGNSTWRKQFIEKYNELGIEFFNPQVEHWTPEMAENEAKHLVEDDIIVFPVLNETFGFGSLAEIGFAVNNAMNLKNKFLIVFIETVDIPTTLSEFEAKIYKENRNARALVLAHLFKIVNTSHIKKTIFVVNSLEEMLEKSIEVNFNFMSKIGKFKFTDYKGYTHIFANWTDESEHNYKEFVAAYWAYNSIYFLEKLEKDHQIMYNKLIDGDGCAKPSAMLLGIILARYAKQEISGIKTYHKIGESWEPYIFGNVFFNDLSYEAIFDQDLCDED